MEGYVNIDLPHRGGSLGQATKPDIYADLRNLHFRSQSVEEVRCHHVLEHFDRATALRLLLDWYDWLHEDGTFTAETPDFERTVESFLTNSAPEHRMKLVRHLYGSQEGPWAMHLDGWYKQKFYSVLRAIGYRKLDFQTSEWQGLHNITVTARKVAPFVPRSDAAAAAEKILALSKVDQSPSEEELYAIWKSSMKPSRKG